jgi:phage terminase small subunit
MSDEIIKIEGLTEKQNLFVNEYLIDFNATRAAKAAGYKESTAHYYGQQLLKNLVIHDAIQQVVEQRNKACQVDAYYVLNKCKQIVEADFLSYLDELECDEVRSLPKELRILVKSMTIRTNKEGDKTYRLNFMDKDRSLELLAKHVGLGMFKVEMGNDNKGKPSLIIKMAEDE